MYHFYGVLSGNTFSGYSYESLANRIKHRSMQNWNHNLLCKSVKSTSTCSGGRQAQEEATLLQGHNLLQILKCAYGMRVTPETRIGTKKAEARLPTLPTSVVRMPTPFANR